MEQAVQVDPAMAAEYMPEGHTVHVDDAGEEAYKPAVHT